MRTLLPHQEAIFASDLHLSESTPHLLQAFEVWMATVAAEHRLIYLIGDLFEVWVGDDHHNAVSERFASACRAAKAAGAEVMLMHGNRDFLMGDAFAEACEAELLPDPEFLKVGPYVGLISHGDQLCTDDKPYQQFRQLSRTEAWQQQFLSQSVDTRLSIAQGMRAQSKAHAASTAQHIMDVNPAAVQAAFQGQWPDGSHIGRCDFVLHGHTHRCAVHTSNSKGQSTPPNAATQSGLIEPGMRLVLPDWREANNGVTQSGHACLRAAETAGAAPQFDLVVVSR